MEPGYTKNMTTSNQKRFRILLKGDRAIYTDPTCNETEELKKMCRASNLTYLSRMAFGLTQSCIVEGLPANVTGFAIRFSDRVLNIDELTNGVVLPFDLPSKEDREKAKNKLKDNTITNTQENTMAKTKRVPVPFFTASGKQYWYDFATGKVGVGNKAHYTHKTTYLFAQKLDDKGNLIRNKNGKRFSVHISQIRALANAPAPKAAKATVAAPAASFAAAVGAWPQPVAKQAVAQVLAGQSLQTADQELRVLIGQLTSQVNSMRSEIASLTRTVADLKTTISEYDGLVRR